MEDWLCTMVETAGAVLKQLQKNADRVSPSSGSCQQRLQWCAQSVRRLAPGGVAKACSFGPAPCTFGRHADQAAMNRLNVPTQSAAEQLQGDCDDALALQCCRPSICSLGNQLHLRGFEPQAQQHPTCRSVHNA